MSDMLPCISILQPYAWLIVNGHKDVENRGWHTVFVTTGPQKMVVADCMHPDWPEWWKARNERPIVSPGAGSACKKHERLARQGEAK